MYDQIYYMDIHIIHDGKFKKEDREKKNKDWTIKKLNFHFKELKTRKTKTKIYES